MPLEQHIEAFEENISTVATMDVGVMWDRMKGEFLAEWARLDRTNISTDELERRMMAFLDDLSERPLQDLARTSSGVAYNQGRNVEILDAGERGEATYAVRSEVLDTNTCRNCQVLDGGVFEIGTPEYEQYMPPAECEGGDRCRGFYIVIRGEA